MKKFFFYTVLGTLMLLNCRSVLASVQTDIEQANKAGKTVFLVITEPGKRDCSGFGNCQGSPEISSRNSSA